MGIISTSIPFVGVRGGRSVGHTSDGIDIACFAAGSDRLRLHWSSNRGATWSLIISAPVANFNQYSMTIDDDDNIHIVYADSASRLAYRRYDRSGTANSWSLAVDETVAGVLALGYVWPDIEVLDSGVVVVTWSRGTFFRMRARSAGGSWGAEFSVEGGNNQTSVARDLAGSSGGYGRVMTFNNRDSAADFSIAEVEESTGNITAFAKVAGFDLQGPAHGSYGHLFSRGPDEWLFIGNRAHSALNSSSTAITLDSNGRLHTQNAANRTTLWPYGIGFAMTQTGNAMKFYPGPSTSALAGGDGWVSTTAPDPAQGLPWLDYRLLGKLDMNTLFYYSGANRNIPDQIMYLLRRKTTVQSRIVASPYSMLAISPSEGEVIQTGEPRVSSLIGTPSGSSGRWGMVAELADDPSFLVNLDILTTRMSTAATVPPDRPRPSGLQYVRFRGIDPIMGVVSAPANAVEYTISHPPSATPSQPANGVTVSAGPQLSLNWTTFDPYDNDFITAVEVSIEGNLSGAPHYSSGKVPQAGNSLIVPTTTIPQDEELRWRVRVWDRDDVESEWSEYALFALALPPEVDITFPVLEEVVESPSPIIEWTYSSPGEYQQERYFVRILDDEGYEVYRSGWIADSVGIHVADAGLENNKTYVILLQVLDSIGLTASDQSTFYTQWVPPAGIDLVEIDVGPYDEDGFVRIEWGTPVVDDEFYSWRVYRRSVGGGSWTKVGEIFEALGDYEFRDYSVCSGTPVEYSVQQAAARFGVIVESDRDPSAIYTPYSSHYWLIDKDDPDNSIKLWHVTADQFTVEHEEEVYQIIGRGRKTEYGTRLGYAGPLTLHLFDQGSVSARMQRLELEVLKELRPRMLLRNPFGDQWPISIGNLTFDRVAGRGTNEESIATLDLREVVE